MRFFSNEVTHNHLANTIRNMDWPVFLFNKVERKHSQNSHQIGLQFIREGQS